MQTTEKHGPVTVFRNGSVTYTGDKGNQLGRLVGSDLSKTMGAAFGTFDNCSVDWTVKYDEVVYVIEGTFRMVIDDVTYEYHPGDFIWIPENTRLIYQGDKARVLFVIWPVDWRDREGAAAST